MKKTDLVFQEATETAITLTPSAVKRAKDFLIAARSENTRKAYKAAWHMWESWTAANKLKSLPADPQNVALWFSELASTNTKYASLQLYKAAINAAHKTLGLPPPCGDQIVRDMLAGIARKKGVAQRRATPLGIEELKAILLKAEGVAGKRDRALLLLSFSLGTRESELLGLDREDLAFVPDGLRATLRQHVVASSKAAGGTKTTTRGEDRVVGVPYAKGDLCAVKAVKAWIDEALIKEGPVFRRVWVGGKIGDDRLSLSGWYTRLLELLTAAGFDAKAYSTHSLRAGFVTSAHKAGARLEEIAGVTGHKDLDMVRRYIRDEDAVAKNPIGKVL